MALGRRSGLRSRDQLQRNLRAARGTRLSPWPTSSSGPAGSSPLGRRTTSVATCLLFAPSGEGALHERGNAERRRYPHRRGDDFGAGAPPPCRCRGGLQRRTRVPRSTSKDASVKTEVSAKKPASRSTRGNTHVVLAANIHRLERHLRLGNGAWLDMHLLPGNRDRGNVEPVGWDGGWRRDFLFTHRGGDRRLVPGDWIRLTDRCRFGPFLGIICGLGGNTNAATAPEVALSGPEGRTSLDHVSRWKQRGPLAHTVQRQGLFAKAVAHRRHISNG